MKPYLTKVMKETSLKTNFSTASRGMPNSNPMRQLQQTAGNRAVLRLLQSRMASEVKHAEPAQRTISVGKEQLFFNNETEALAALKTTFPSIPPEVLEIILSSFNADPEYGKFHNLASLKHEVQAAAQWMMQKDAYDVNKDDWGVLHRLKGKLKPKIADLPQTREEGSFNRFIKAQNENADASAKQTDYEGTDSKYDPTKFSNDGSNSHTWAGNERWLERAMGKFTKMLLTDIPLNMENVRRQSSGEYGFSAYAREIAALLSADYLPVGRKTFRSSAASVDTVSMVRKDQLPKSIMLVINQKIKINKAAAQKVYNDDGISTKAALEFFDEAGLPTDKAPDKSLKLEKAQTVVPRVEITDEDRIVFLAGKITDKSIPSDKEFWKGIQADEKGRVYFADWGFKTIHKFANVNASKIFGT